MWKISNHHENNTGTILIPREEQAPNKLSRGITLTAMPKSSRVQQAEASYSSSHVLAALNLHQNHKYSAARYAFTKTRRELPVGCCEWTCRAPRVSLFRDSRPVQLGAKILRTAD